MTGAVPIWYCDIWPERAATVELLPTKATPAGRSILVVAGAQLVEVPASNMTERALPSRRPGKSVGRLAAVVWVALLPALPSCAPWSYQIDSRGTTRPASVSV